MSAPRLPQDPRRGIVAMLIAMVVLSLNDALVKYLGELGYGPFQIAFLRTLVALPALLLFIVWRGGGRAALRPRRPWELLGRSLTFATSIFLFFWAVRYLSLTDAYTLIFTAPLFVTALSGPVLGDRVGWRRWAAVGAGFLGCVVAFQPGAGLFNLYGFAMIAAAFLFAAGGIWTRRLAGETTAVITLALTVVTGVLGGLGALLPGQWHPPQTSDLAAVASVALLSLVGQLALTEAYRVAPPVVVAPLDYTALIWALVIDFLVWGVLPGWPVGLGCIIIMASGLYIIHREAVLNLRGPAATVPAPTVSATVAIDVDRERP